MRIRRLLVANRSEIAIRVFRAATELGIRTVAVYAEEDKLSLHRFKADEAYLIGRGPHLQKPLGAIEAYLCISEIIRVAKERRIDAIHPGYGFLSESPEFAEACAAAGVIFIGPSPETMRQLGNKVAARNLAISIGVPVMPASDPLPDDVAVARKTAAKIGYPVMLKASWGGGGRGMRPIYEQGQLADALTTAKREARAAFGKDEVYLEKLVTRARHVEVQILADHHGTAVHLFERDCSIQRRNQKVVERAPAPYLDSETRNALCEAALKIARATKYVGAGTVEFLMDADTGAFYFIEVNPRIQVEHTVTEVVTRLDIVQAQIRIAQKGRIGARDADHDWDVGIPPQEDITVHGHALQCRITTENPENKFIPDYGRIAAYRGAFGFGIRVDGGTAYAGAVVTRFYDPLLEKVTAWAPTPAKAIDRMARALMEYRIRGVATNLAFLHNIVTHPSFRSNDYTTRFIDDTPSLFDFRRRRDRATKLLTYLAHVTVNGQPDVKGRPRPAAQARAAQIPIFAETPHIEGSRQRFERMGPSAFAAWMRDENRVLVTDTSMRDAHQSLLATRMRTHDISCLARAYANGLPELFSLECWGGATFDVAMRFLMEDPWERLHIVRERAPNILTQMLVRGANGVGYTNYPDNVVRLFIERAALAGMDLFRIFDCFNWIESMRTSIDAVLENGKLAEGAICYTGDILDSKCAKYDLKYYVALAKDLERAGCHILGVKDMAGLLKPAAAHLLVKTLKEEVALPLHFHTHDTSGIGGASVLAAIEAGADAVDLAMDAVSGATSQPCLGSIVEALRDGKRDTRLDPDAIRRISSAWEHIRAQYAAFETDTRSGASEVYRHGMPGGQSTNLKEQARSLGLDTRWHDVAKAYCDANMLLGDVIKVTPSSKVVGDLALMMVAQNLTPADVLDPNKEIAFPASVVEMLRGDLGQPPGGWPEEIQKKALKDQAPIATRPGALLPPADFEAQRAECEQRVGRVVSDEELVSSLMYPKVFADYVAATRRYGPLSSVPTPAFFYGMAAGEELAVEIEDGKTLVIQLTAIGEPRDNGTVEVFFELNGQPRIVTVPLSARGVAAAQRRKADDGNDAHVSAPFAASVASIAVHTGQRVEEGDLLLTLEAMKMEMAIHARKPGDIAEILAQAGMQVDANDLLMVIA